MTVADTHRMDRLIRLLHGRFGLVGPHRDDVEAARLASALPLVGWVAMVLGGQTFHDGWKDAVLGLAARHGDVDAVATVLPNLTVDESTCDRLLDVLFDRVEPSRADTLRVVAGLSRMAA